jgi:RND family efflux transporter MFP subunit
MLQKLRTMKKRYWALLILGVVILVLVIGKKTQPTSYTEFTVEKTEVSDVLVLAGVVDVDSRVDLGFAQSGRVAEILKQTGDPVGQGDLIARIDQNQVQSQLIQAQANLNAVSATATADEVGAVENLATTLEEQEEIVESAYRALLNNDLQAYLDEDESAARTYTAPTITGTYLDNEVGEYIIDVYASNAPSGFSFRLSGLDSGTYAGEIYKSGRLGNSGLFIQFDSSTNYQSSRWVVPIPNTRSTTYTSVRNTYETALATKQKTLASLENNLEKISEGEDGLSLSAAQTQQAKAQVNAVYAELRDGRITAPFSGIVAKNDLELGQIVSAYSPVVTVVNSLDKELVLNIPEIYIDAISVGDTVAISIDAFENSMFSGVITHIDIIDTLVDGVPVYQTTVLMNEQKDSIRIGMNATAEIVTESVSGVLAVPGHFIESEDETSYVNILTETGIERVLIETGLRGSNGLVEVRSGLSEGQTVVIEKE